jgi:2Fe-2S ferredoxin
MGERSMAEMVVVDRSGKEHRITARAGTSVMETLRDGDFDMAAICCGMCSCATCHIYVDESWMDKLPAAQGDETELLRELSSYKPNSRLSCQVTFTDSLDGLKIAVGPDE